MCNREWFASGRFYGDRGLMILFNSSLQMQGIYLNAVDLANANLQGKCTLINLATSQTSSATVTLWKRGYATKLHEDAIRCSCVPWNETQMDGH